MKYNKIIISSALFLSFIFSNAQAALIDFTGSSLNDIDQYDYSTFKPITSATELVIDTHGDISDLNVSYALGHSLVNVGADNFNGSEINAAEVTVWLTHVDSNTSLQLYDSQTSWDNSINITLDDEATDVLPFNDSSDWVGTYQPYNGDGNSLSIFDGLDIFGTWELSFYDSFGLFSGVNGTDLISWGLEATLVDDNNTVDVPEPPMVMLMIALIALFRVQAFSKK